MTDADRARRPARLLPAAALAAAGAATALALVAAARRLRALDPRLTRTMFGPALTYATAGPDGDAVRVLSVGGAFQSAAYLDGRPDAPFAYLRAFDAMLDAGVPVHRVLMLGGGAFAYPRHLLARRPDVRLDVVEVDPAIVALARRRFFLADAERAHGDHMRVITADAASYLRERAAGAPAPRYDAIANDVFRGADPDAGLLSPEGLALVRANLAPGGLYLVNVVVPDSPEGAARLLDVARALRGAFAHVSLLPCADEGFSALDNYLAVASDAPLALPGELPLPPA
ncbi:MAG: fused MFS/spermidine synthase [Eggerthellaceae bacterium]|nr:fused MFS/spermidine synthase [Eggerthellaceae bacterium]